MVTVWTPVEYGGPIGSLNGEGVCGIGQYGGNDGGGFHSLQGLRVFFPGAVSVQEDPTACGSMAAGDPGQGDLVEVVCLDGAVCNGNGVCGNGNPGVLAHTGGRDLHGISGVCAYALDGGGAAGDGYALVKAAGIVAPDGPAVTGVSG